jgi:hypothetical protein
MKAKYLLVSAVLCVTLLGTESSALAGSATTGLVSNITVSRNDEAAIFIQSGTRSGAPACASANPTKWAIDVYPEVGKATLSMLLTAYSLGKRVTITGTGTCDAYGTAETVSFINIDE